LQTASSFAVVEGAAISFAPLDSSAVGVHTIKLTLTDDDSNETGKIRSSIATFEVEVLSFSCLEGSLSPLQVKVGEIKTLKLGSYNFKLCEGSQFSWTLVGESYLPHFMTQNSANLVVSPSLESQEGYYEVELLIHSKDGDTGTL